MLCMIKYDTHNPDGIQKWIFFGKIFTNESCTHKHIKVLMNEGRKKMNAEMLCGNIIHGTFVIVFIVFHTIVRVCICVIFHN